MPTTPPRTIAVLSCIVGGLAIAAAVTGASLSSTFEIAALPAGWKPRWLLSMAVLGLSGAAALAGGVLLWLRRWTGLLCIAAAMALWVLFPWMLRLRHDELYGFEMQHPIEAIVFGAATVLALVAYVRKSRPGPGA